MTETKVSRGLVGIGGFIPADQVREHVEPGSMNFILGGNGFFGYFFAESDPAAPHRDAPYQVSEPGESLAWWSTYSADECPDPKTLDKDGVVRQLRERHANWGDPVIQSILHSLHVDNMYPTWTSPTLPKWERFGVVLVGDAAHALPPTSGQGSSQALEDVEALSMFLAHYLGRISDRYANTQDYTLAIRRATKDYEQLRQPHVANILKRAQQSQNSKHTMSWVEEYAMYWFMWVLGGFLRV